MKIAICDDDKNELFRILSVLADYQTQRNIEFSYKPFDNSTELASNLLQEHYDIYLLDVVMPGLNGIELAKEIEYRDVPKVVFKEIRVALICGITLSAANFVKLLLLDKVGVLVAASVCLTLVAAVVIAMIIGCLLPILAKRLGFDPAVMASPFITTIVDAMSLLVYFRVASAILGL